MAREDKLESLITGFVLISIIFLTINFELTIGTIFIGMIVFSIWRFLSGDKITHNSKPNNTFTAILTAGTALVVILLVTFFLTSAFQGLLNVTVTPTLGSILNSGFSTLGVEKIIPADKLGKFVNIQAAQPIFSGSVLLTIFTFGIVIAVIETRFLARFMEWLAGLANINLDKLTFPVILLFTIISSVFVWYHFNAKGVTANVPLLLTFIFAFISLEMIRRTGEIESATYFHVFNNLLFITSRVQAG